MTGRSGPVVLPLVRAHLIAGFAYFLAALIAGFLFSFTFLQAYPFPGVELLSPGRLRMVHTNGVAFGWIVTTFMGLMYYVVPRLTGQPIWSERLGWGVFWAWNALVVGTVVGILTGHAQGIEWAETPKALDPFIVVVVALYAVNVFVPIVRSKEPAFYVSLWYFIAALVWTALNYIMGNFLPEYFVGGTAGAAITSMYIHDLVGLFVTPVGVGVSYYLLPVVLRRPVYSHALSLVGFWALAFFYPLNSVHHYLYSPIPMWVQYASVVVSVGVHVVVYTVLWNFYMTLRGEGRALAESLPVRWIAVGSIFYLLTCVQCAVQVTLSVQEVIHFTDWVVSHAHMVMFGTFGFFIFAWIDYLWPRFHGRPIWSPRLAEWHFWLTAGGLSIMVIDLLAAGVVQGMLWINLSPFIDSVIASRPFWLTRSIAGTAILLGQILHAYNLWRSARAEAPATEAVAEPVAAGV